MPNWPPYNWEYLTALSYASASAIETIEQAKITITSPYLNHDPKNETQVEEDAIAADWLYDYSNPDEPIEPASDLFFPIQDNIKSVESDPSVFPTVAVFVVTFYWRDFIRDILPESSKGVLVVVENPCSASFTYRLDGPVTTLLGRGDRHDRKYNYMELESTMNNLNSFRIRESTYSGPKLSEEHCPFTFKIYPTEDTENEYKTSNPVIFSIITVLICLVATALFLVYDRFQEKRQRVVMENAKRTDAVISSLFPAVIRKKLIASQEATNKNAGPTKGGTSLTNAPIAELYSHTTLLFADISGFTAWASTRDASEVFMLLESIYFEFDVLARKHRVFKVETIGDTYVAGKSSSGFSFICGHQKRRRRWMHGRT